MSDQRDGLTVLSKFGGNVELQINREISREHAVVVALILSATAAQRLADRLSAAALRGDPKIADSRPTADRSLSDVIADRVRLLRKQAGFNREILAERCAGLGMPELTAAALTNIETGRRQGGARRRMVTVDELAVLAEALCVSFYALLDTTTP